MGGARDLQVASSTRALSGLGYQTGCVQNDAAQKRNSGITDDVLEPLGARPRNVLL